MMVLSLFFVAVVSYTFEVQEVMAGQTFTKDGHSRTIRVAPFSENSQENAPLPPSKNPAPLNSHRKLVKPNTRPELNPSTEAERNQPGQENLKELGLEGNSFNFNQPGQEEPLSALHQSDQAKSILPEMNQPGQEKTATIRRGSLKLPTLALGKKPSEVHQITLPEMNQPGQEKAPTTRRASIDLPLLALGKKPSEVSKEIAPDKQPSEVRKPVAPDQKPSEIRKPIVRGKKLREVPKPVALGPNEVYKESLLSEYQRLKAEQLVQTGCPDPYGTAYSLYPFMALQDVEFITKEIDALERIQKYRDSKNAAKSKTEFTSIRVPNKKNPDKVEPFSSQYPIFKNFKRIYDQMKNSDALTEADFLKRLEKSRNLVSLGKTDKLLSKTQMVNLCLDLLEEDGFFHPDRLQIFDDHDPVKNPQEIFQPLPESENPKPLESPKPVLDADDIQKMTNSFNARWGNHFMKMTYKELQEYLWQKAARKLFGKNLPEMESEMKAKK